LEEEQKRLNEGILIFCLKSSLFWDIARRRVDIDVSEQHTVPIFKDPAVYATSQNSEDLKHATAEVRNLCLSELVIFSSKQEDYGLNREDATISNYIGKRKQNQSKYWQKETKSE
jgi:hypothetical protein